MLRLQRCHDKFGQILTRLGPWSRLDNYAITRSSRDLLTAGILHTHLEDPRYDCHEELEHDH